MGPTTPAAGRAALPLAITNPASPARELTRMNAAETAAAWRGTSQPRRIIRGVRKMPPPVPVMPASPPRRPPVRLMLMGPGTAGETSTGWEGCDNRQAENSSTSPSRRWSSWVGKETMPPTNAAGTENRASGRNTSRRKWPAAAKFQVARLDTSTLRTSARGRISAAAKPLSASTAM